jgi:hypothetical protein
MSTATTGAGRYALTVEGVGTASTDGGARKSGLTRWTWGAAAPSWDTGGLYQPGLTGWPQEIETSIDWLEGKAQQGGMRLRLAQSPAVLQAFYAMTAPRLALATEAITSTGTTVKLTSAALQNALICWQRESIKLGTVASTASGVTTYINCARARLGTVAQAHDPADDPEVFASVSAETLEGRICRLYWVPETAASYADEVLLFAGALRDVAAVGQELELQINTLLDLVQGAYLCQAPWTSYAGTGPRYVALRAPAAGQLGVDPRMVVRVGDAVVLAPWRKLGGRYHEVVVADAQRLPGSPGVAAPDGQDVSAREVLAVYPGAPALSSGVALAQDVGALVVQLLTGSPGVEEIPPVIPADLVDADQIEGLAASLGARVDGLLIGLDGPEPLADVLARLLRPWGLVLVPGAAGRLQLAAFSDAPLYGTGGAISQAQVTQIGALGGRNLGLTADEVIVTYGGDAARLAPGGAPTVTGLGAYRRQRAPRGGVGLRPEVDAGALLSEAEAQRVAAGLLARYHRPPPALEVTVTPDADAALGAVVTLTHAALPGDGAQGLTAARALVTARREILRPPQGRDLAGGSREVRLGLLMVGLIHRRAGWLSPVCRVLSWDAGTNTATVESYHADPDADPAEDIDALAVGDGLQLCDSDWSLITTLIEIHSFPAGNQIRFTGAPSTAPALGDLLRVDVYANANAAQIESWAFVSDSDGELANDPALAYTWET